jgi:hypothetical protein
MAPTARIPVAAASAAAAMMTLLLASTALAGGWASATLDEQPTDPGAGGTMEIGFTLLQHGVTPVDWGQPLVMLVNDETGQRVTADARQSGAKGHWTAELTVPSAGRWTLDIRHDLEVVPANFEPITIGGAAAAQPAATPSSLAIQPALLAVALFLGGVAIAAAAIGTLAWRRARTGPAGI